jgi:hypothetical protein
MDSHEAQLHQPPSSTARARRGTGHTISRLNERAAARVLAPKHERKHRGFHSARFDQHEPFGSSVEIPKNRPMLFRPDPNLLFDGAQD